MLWIKKLLKDIQSSWAQKIDEIEFIPISGITGVNLIESSQKMEWRLTNGVGEGMEGAANRVEEVRAFVEGSVRAQRVVSEAEEHLAVNLLARRLSRPLTAAAVERAARTGEWRASSRRPVR